MKAKEAAAKTQRDLGRLGARGFKSRSMKSWQEAYERGEATHLMPLENAKKKLARGEIKIEDIPYMQRPGGNWDDSDVGGAKKKRWLQSDKEYAAGGWKKELSAGIFGGTQHEAWQNAWGVNRKQSGQKASNDVEMWKASGARFGAEKKSFRNGWGLKKDKVANINNFSGNAAPKARGAAFGKSAPKAAEPPAKKKPFWQR